jgi:hypothetical protein
MKVIDHVTKNEIGEMKFNSFKVDDTFRIQFSDGSQKYYLVTGVDYSDDGKVYFFEMTKDQYNKGLRIKDLLV